MGGSSLGGRLALEVAARGRAASVTALSPAGFWTRDRELTYVKGVFWAMYSAGAALRPLGPAMAGSTAGRGGLYAAVVGRPARVGPGQGAGGMTAVLGGEPGIRGILAEAFPFTARGPVEVPG